MACNRALCYENLSVLSPAQAFGQFCNGTDGSLELTKGVEHKWRNHPKLTQRVF